MLVVSRKAIGDGYFELGGSNDVFGEWDEFQAALGATRARLRTT